MDAYWWDFFCIQTTRKIFVMFFQFYVFYDFMTYYLCNKRFLFVALKMYSYIWFSISMGLDHSNVIYAKADHYLHANPKYEIFKYLVPTISFLVEKYTTLLQYKKIRHSLKYPNIEIRQNKTNRYTKFWYIKWIHMCFMPMPVYSSNSIQKTLLWSDDYLTSQTINQRLEGISIISFIKLQIILLSYWKTYIELIAHQFLPSSDTDFNYFNL